MSGFEIVEILGVAGFVVSEILGLIPEKYVKQSSILSVILDTAKSLTKFRR
ncbi:MAG TPA: hypothetical protein VK982_10475 [Bacteroidales bacterium]|nr:hypothetical protein [Bacteroidales bacterium]